MAKILLIAGGVLNTIFFALHATMFYGLTHAKLSPDVRGLLLAFNVAGTLTILFFALVSFSNRRELLGTQLGRALMVLIAVFYLARASEEFYWFPFQHAIFWPCLLTAGVYVALLFLAGKESSKAKPAPVEIPAMAGSR